MMFANKISSSTCCSISLPEDALFCSAFEKSGLDHPANQPGDHRSRRADHLCQIFMRELRNQNSSSRVFDARAQREIAQHQLKAIPEGQTEERCKPSHGQGPERIQALKHMHQGVGIQLAQMAGYKITTYERYAALAEGLRLKETCPPSTRVDVIGIAD